MTVDIETRGLDDMSEFFKRLPEVAEHAAQLSVNDSARFARRESAKQILEEVNYPKSYLKGDDNGRLAITQFATRDNLEAIIKGRDRPTSLASFAMTPVRFGRQKGIKVQVSRKGGAKTLASAFYMRLRRGRDLDQRNHNVGLAVRVRKGERLSGSTAAMDLGNGVYLLYGPSVDQVFQGVAADVVDEVSDMLTTQFLRQFERLSNGR